jgi:hypothetical protein
MLADVSDLRDYGLQPSDAAMSEVSNQERCDLCRAPALSRAASQATTLAWLDAYAPVEGVRLRAATIREAADPAGDAANWQSVRTRMAIDSELWPGYPVPADVLEIVVARLDPTLEAFVPDAFLAMICGRCAAEPATQERHRALVTRVFVERHAQGNGRVARAQPSWSLVERFADIVDDAARVAIFA